MRMITFAYLGCLAAVLAMVFEPSIASGTSPEAVTPIDWTTFNSTLASHADPQSALGKNGQLLLNTVRYNHDWIPSAYVSTAQGYVPRNTSDPLETQIRSGAMAAVGISTMLATNLYQLKPETLGGATIDAIASRNVRLIRGLASKHIANGSTGASSWGAVNVNSGSGISDWQTALWASNLGQAAWMSWNRLDAADKQNVVRMIEHEANRFLQPNYIVPFWDPNNSNPRVAGDTKAEESAWNSTVLQLAVAMMPNHVHANEWRQRASELMVTAFARPSDAANAQVVDGRSVEQWINGRGYNANVDGTLVNHQIVHPDYMATTSLTVQSHLLQSLAKQNVPQAAGWNAEVIWQSLVKTNFSSPPYASPGGTMYREGQALLYYPQGTDWGPNRLDIFYQADVNAEVLGYDVGTPDAATWRDLRGDHLLTMQARPGGAPGQTFRPGDWTNDYPPKEQQVALVLGNAYLMQWLHAQAKLMPKGNWIPQVFVKDPGFENVELASGAAINFNNASISPAWTVASGNKNDAGVQNFVASASLGDQFDPSYYNGNHKALFVNSRNGSTAPVIKQVLDATLEQHVLYTLSLDVGSLGLAPSDLESYRVQLVAGDAVLAEIREGDGGAPTLVDKQFIRVMLSFTFDASSAAMDLVGKPLEIHLTNPTVNSSATLSQTLFDNVTLTAVPVPEPHSGMLTGTAILLAGAEQFRRLWQRSWTAAYSF